MATITETGTRQYKVVAKGPAGETWYGNNGTMVRSNCSGWNFTTAENNCNITFDFPGDYTFALVNNTPQITVTYPNYSWEATNTNYATLCLPLDATLEGATAYSVSATSASEITIAPIVGNLVAGTPYIIKPTAAGTITATLSGAAVADPVNTGVLKGNLSATPVNLTAADNAYILSTDDNQFHLISGTATATVGQYKAYLQGNLGSAPIRIVETTDVATSLEDANAAEKVQKFVENGKLVIVKDGVRYNALGQTIK